MVPFFALSYGNETSESSKNMDMASPWKQCAKALDSSSSNWRFNDSLAADNDVEKDGANNSGSEIEVINIDGEESKSISNKESEHCILFQCGCPTVDKWAHDEWERWIKKKSSSKKKSCSGRGKKRKRKHSCLESLDKSQASALPGESGNHETENGSEEEEMINSEVISTHLICGKRTNQDTLCPCDFNPVCSTPT